MVIGSLFPNFHLEKDLFLEELMVNARKGGLVEVSFKAVALELWGSCSNSTWELV